MVRMIERKAGKLSGSTGELQGGGVRQQDPGSEEEGKSVEGQGEQKDSPEGNHRNGEFGPVVPGNAEDFPNLPAVREEAVLQVGMNSRKKEKGADESGRGEREISDHSKHPEGESPKDQTEQPARKQGNPDVSEQEKKHADTADEQTGDFHFPPFGEIPPVGPAQSLDVFEQVAERKQVEDGDET